MESSNFLHIFRMSLVRRRALCALVLLCLFYGGCAFRSGHTHYKVTPLQGFSKLAKSEKAYVPVPAHFSQGSVVEINSGKETLKAFQASVATGNIVTSTVPLTLEQSRVAAKEAQCAYLIMMEIVEWNDPSAFVQGSSDRGEVMVRTYDVASGKVLRSDNLECSGTPTTINYIGSYSPADCLKPAFKQWYDDIFE